MSGRGSLRIVFSPALVAFRHQENAQRTYTHPEPLFSSISAREEALQLTPGSHQGPNLSRLARSLGVIEKDGFAVLPYLLESPRVLLIGGAGGCGLPALVNDFSHVHVTRLPLTGEELVSHSRSDSPVNILTMRRGEESVLVLAGVLRERGYPAFPTELEEVTQGKIVVVDAVTVVGTASFTNILLHRNHPCVIRAMTLYGDDQLGNIASLLLALNIMAKIRLIHAANRHADTITDFTEDVRVLGMLLRDLDAPESRWLLSEAVGTLQELIDRGVLSDDHTDLLAMLSSKPIPLA